MFRWLKKLFLVLYCSCNYGIGDCFYIFDVGQGNCQLAIYEEEKIGILFDCGTSSTRGLVKFNKLQKSDSTLIFERKSYSIEQAPEVVSLEQFIKESPTMEVESEAPLSQTLTDSCDERNLPSLSDLINEYGLKYLFIILSHPDKDHINLVNSDFLSKLSPSVMILFEGDWFNPDKGEAKDVLAKLKAGGMVFSADFPFYRGGLLGVNKEECKTYKEILELFRSENSSLPKNEWQSIIPALVLEDLYSVVLRNSLDREKEFKFFEDILHTGDFSYVYSPLFDVLKNVKIAHINFPFKEVNSQSSIVEIKMPKLKMQFFLTGDASNETFARIVEYDKNFFKKDEDFTTLAMLPHHGSQENKSALFFKLFRPDIIGISAGDGGQFTHPSETFIKEIKDQGYEGSFWDCFKLKNLREAGITFQDKQKNSTRRSALVLRNKETIMPFVCTNLLGTIKIDQEGFWADFSNIIEVVNGAYIVNYTQHVAGITCTEEEIGHIKESDGKSYFCVGKDLCYPAKKFDPKSKATDPME